MRWIKAVYWYCRQKLSRDRLKYMPLFILLGHQKSGKHSLLEASDLIFMDSKDWNKSRLALVSQFPGNAWFVAGKMAFLKYTFGVTTTSAKTSTQAFAKLSRFRATKSINIVLITLEMAAFAKLSTTELQRMPYDYLTHLQCLQTKYGKKIPVYLIFTQCDQLIGFEEFIRALDQSKIDMPFGITATDNFNQEYERFMKNLYHTMINMFSWKKQLDFRQKLFLFYTQLQKFKQPLIDFCASYSLLQLQGVYFTSAQQSSDKIDLSAPAHSQYLSLPLANNPDSQPSNCSYFIKNLFKDTFLQEAFGLQRQKIKARRHYYLKLFSLIGLPVIVGLGLMAYPKHLNTPKHSTTPTLQTLNHLWQKQVVKFYNKKLAHYYPFNANAIKTADIHAFTQFFRPKGLLDHYVHYHLKPFITVHPHTLSNQMLLTLKNAIRIRALFFKSHQMTPSLHFCLKPYTLSAAISHLKLVIGRQSIVYQHGPRLTTCIQWPDGTKKFSCEIHITNLNGKHYHKRYLGFWSLWQLLKFTYQYHYLSIPVSRYQATFEVTNTASFKQMLVALAHFRLPNKLTQ